MSFEKFWKYYSNSYSLDEYEQYFRKPAVEPAKKAVKRPASPTKKKLTEYEQLNEKVPYYMREKVNEVIDAQVKIAVPDSLLDPELAYSEVADLDYAYPSAAAQCRAGVCMHSQLNVNPEMFGYAADA